MENPTLTPKSMPVKDSAPEDSPIDALNRLVALLRGVNGCAWDQKQTPRTMSNYLIEEIYELVDAIESGTISHICEELGDVLFHVFFIAYLFEERGHFSVQDVAAAITKKMIRRHPHVFGTKTVQDTNEIRDNWHKIKAAEQKNTSTASALDAIPIQLPALMRAYRISERAARTGFDWHDIDGVMQKVEEEWSEFKEALNAQNTVEADQDQTAMEFGDILFTLTNVARFARIHPETALTSAIKKFEKRFRDMETRIAQSGRSLEEVSFQEMNTLWEKVKRQTENK